MINNYTRHDGRYAAAVSVSSHLRQITAGLDGGHITSDGGVMMLSEVERRLGLVDRPAAVVCDPRDQQVRHGLADALPAFIACGYEDPDDIDVLRTGPAFQVACGQVASAAQH